MELSTAITVFKQLETERETEHEGDPPTYDVRLDAKVARASEERYYRIFVTSGAWPLPRDRWLYVLEVAGEHDLDVTPENNGVELA